MCGISGFVEFGRRTPAHEMAAVAGRMASALLHRGPDDAGVWVDADSGVALGHRRLSILDLSPAGHQPMQSAGGRYVVVYNGEIYNWADLRDELLARGVRFRGHSDTEVILAATEEWGFERALDRFNGMFAIALWDRAERALSLARDRLGEKPLYYGIVGGSLLFGSELKALWAHPRFEGVVDRRALTAFLRFGYVPAPQSIFGGIRKLPPASCLRVREATDVSRQPSRYWSLADVARQSTAHRFRGSEADALEELERLLRDSIRLRMVSDVPLGAFLSGGIDSSTIVALMQAQSPQPVRTFTVGFREEAYDEAKHARAIAQCLGTTHTELYVTPDEARSVVPQLPGLYDEPFADSSQIPTFLVARLARRSVTVALSGDAGDELFGGYTRYLWAERVWRAIRRLPRVGRRVARAALLGLSPSQWDAVFSWAGERVPVRLRQRTPGDKLQKIADLMAADSEHDAYLRLASIWKEPGAVACGGLDAVETRTRDAAALGVRSFVEQMMYSDTLTYLPDDILVKVDRATMGVSLEGRIPFLDPRLVSLAWQLPLEMKIRSGVGKWPLRRILEKYVPRALFERPKMGFGVPIDAWLRGPLRGWAESLLDEGRLRQEGFFEAAPVRGAWEEHLSGVRNHQHSLWAILMFQAWLDGWRGRRAPTTTAPIGVAAARAADPRG